MGFRSRTRKKKTWPAIPRSRQEPEKVGEDPSVPIKRVHKMTVDQVKKEMSATELKWSETIEVLPRQHIIIFTKP